MSVNLVVVTKLTDGLPLYFFQNDLHLEMDPTLFSGFLAAAASFGQAVRGDSPMTDLNLGELRLHFHYGPKVITILGTTISGYSESEKTIIDFTQLQRYHELTAMLGKSFHQVYGETIDNWDGSLDTFNDFYKTINLILGPETRFVEKEFLQLLSGYQKGNISQRELVDTIWEMVEVPKNARDTNSTD